MAKNPKAVFQPSPKKFPHIAKLPTREKRPKAPHVRGGPLVWWFSTVDRSGPFAWSALDDPAVYKAAMEKLHHFEMMEETDMRRGSSHPIQKDQLCKDARDRLVEIDLDDLDELMSFRLTGTGRVWCRMINSTMLVLWWDPEHRVCPSLKKHT